MPARPLLGAFARQAFPDLSPATNDDLPPVAAMDPVVDAVVASAVLVCAAFRLRDEDGFVVALRQLTAAVTELEAAVA